MKQVLINMCFAENRHKLSSMAQNIMLDAMISVLSDMSQDDEDSLATQEGPAPGTVEASPPTSPGRSMLRLKYISSSSAKRKMIKSTNCCFCVQNYDNPVELRAHLEASESCQWKYFRRFHHKTIDAVLNTLFTCVFCVTKDRRLFYHLENYPDCKAKYLEKFDCASIRFVLKIIYLNIVKFKTS